MDGYFSHLLENPRGLSWSWRTKDAKCCFIPGQRCSKPAIHRNTYIPKNCPILWPCFPTAVGGRQLWSLETEDEQLHSTRMSCFPRRKKEHFGMQELLPNAASPSLLNIPAWEMRFFFLLNKPLSVTHSWALQNSSEILTLLLKNGT